MPTVANFINSGAQLGPGSPFVFSYDGAISAGDYFFAAISTHGTTPPGDQLFAGIVKFTQSHSAALREIDGWFNLTTNFEGPTHASLISPYTKWPEIGLSVYVYGAFVHGVTTVADNQTIGFVYEPSNGYGNLMAFVFNQALGSNGSDIADIKAAVIRTFPAP